MSLMQPELDISSPIGLVAGSGTFPLLFAKNARKAGLKVVGIAHVGETDEALSGLTDELSWIKLGQLGKGIRIFKRAGVKQAVLLGGISRIKLFGGIKLDLRGLALVARVRSFRDDIILRGVANELEKDGIRVLPAHVLLKDCLVQSGVLTKRSLSDDEIISATVGWRAAKTLGAADIGQTVVVCNGVVAAVEAIEGTDRCIRRVKELGQRNGVVVKVSKPIQDLRIDLPAIGENTLKAMIDVGATALVLESGKAILTDPQSIVTLANAHGISIVAYDAEEGITKRIS